LLIWYIITVEIAAKYSGGDSMPKLSKGVRSALEWVEVIVVSVVLALLINLFVIQPIKVDGESMMPTLHDNDFVIISRLGRTFNLKVDYGDIVVIDNRINIDRKTIIDDIKEISIFNRFENRHLWIKRIIGKPGDTIEIRDGKVFRNGERLDEPYLKDPVMNDADKSFYVPEGHVFVMGDNRNNSMDSRRIGTIPVDNIKGVLAVDISGLFR
jgi:signal peptidase I